MGHRTARVSDVLDGLSLPVGGTYGVATRHGDATTLAGLGGVAGRRWPTPALRTPSP